MPLRRQILAAFTLVLSGCTRALAKASPGILDLAREAPPPGVARFAAAFTGLPGHPPTARFELTCAHCAGDRFTVFEHRPEDAAQASGLGLKCLGCNAAADLFDARRDGYDGELGHNGPPSPARAETPLKTRMGRDLGPVGVRVSLAYNVELEELKEIAGERGKRPQDLFDWFILDVKRGARWTETVWDYECA